MNNLEQLHNSMTYLILAGGRGQRMQGTDKGLMLWQGKPMVEHIIEQLAIPSQRLMISANRNLNNYRQYSEQVFSDQLDDYQGPLSGLNCALQQCQTHYILCIPCDSPSPPTGLAEQLYKCMQEQHKSAAICHDGDRPQPLFCLIDRKHKHQLDEFLQLGRRKVLDFMQLIDVAVCDFSTQKAAFHNFNRVEDMQHVE